MLYTEIILELCTSIARAVHMGAQNEPLMNNAQ